MTTSASAHPDELKSGVIINNFESNAGVSLDNPIFSSGATATEEGPVDIARHPQGSMVVQHGVKAPGIYLDDQPVTDPINTFSDPVPAKVTPRTAPIRKAAVKKLAAPAPARKAVARKAVASKPVRK